MTGLVKPNASDFEQGNQASAASSLEQMVANTCFCKLREQCVDKSSIGCMKHCNIYQEFMQAKR